MQKATPIRELNLAATLASLATGASIYHLSGYPLPIDLFIDSKEKRLPLVVFGQGMQAREDIKLPYFLRMKWASMLNANVIIVNEPTLYLHESLILGWCLGTSS
jgi:hypothetical protein